MTMLDRREMRKLLETDAEANPLETLRIPGHQIRNGRHLVPDLVAAFPHPHAVERFVLEIVTRCLKQEADALCLGGAFVDAVKRLDPALPEPVRETMTALADHARAQPFPVEDASLLAHGICMDGVFRSWALGTPPPRKRASKANTKDAYRKLAQRLHPDRQGGDGEAMAALNVLRDAAGAR